MDTIDPLEHLTLLERAQLLHDATLRRHGELLDRLEEERTRHAWLHRLCPPQVHLRSPSDVYLRYS